MATPPLKTLFKNIADAIRNKTGKTTQIPTSQFASEIANIKLITPTLYKSTISANMENSVVTTSKVNGAVGTVLDLQAYTPNPDLQFDGWYLGDTKVSSDEILNYTMVGQGTLQAKYYTAYTVTVLYSPIAGKLGGLKPGGRYEPGQTCTLTFTQDGTQKSYVTFMGWYVNNLKVSSSTTYSFTVTKSVVVECRTVTKALQVSAVTDIGYLITGGTYSTMAATFRAGDNAIFIIGKAIPSKYFSFQSGGDWTRSTCRGSQTIVVNSEGTKTTTTENSSDLVLCTTSIYNPNNKCGYYHGGLSTYITNDGSGSYSPYHQVNVVSSYGAVSYYNPSLTLSSVTNSTISGIGNGCGIATNGDTLFLGGVGNVQVPANSQQMGGLTRGAFINTFLRITTSNTCTSSVVPTEIGYCAFSLILNLQNYTFIGIGRQFSSDSMQVWGNSSISVDFKYYSNFKSYKVGKLDTSGVFSYLDDASSPMVYSNLLSNIFPHFDQFTLNGKAVRINGPLIDVYDQSGTHTVVEYPNNGSYSTSEGFRAVSDTHIMYPQYNISTPAPTEEKPNNVNVSRTNSLYTLDISLTLTNTNVSTKDTLFSQGVALDNRVIYAGLEGHNAYVPSTGQHIYNSYVRAYTFTYSFAN